VLADRLLRTWTQDDDARRYLQVHAHEGVQWFNKECFDELVWWSFAAEVITHRIADTDKAMVTEEETNVIPPAPETAAQASNIQDNLVRDNLVQVIGSAYAVIQLLLEAEQQSGYQLDLLVVN
jgi:hypothetical protein